MKFALLLAKENVVPEAIEILEAVKQRVSSSYELAFNLAGLYVLQKNFGRALDSYDQALILNPRRCQPCSRPLGSRKIAKNSSVLSPTGCAQRKSSPIILRLFLVSDESA